MERLGVEDDEMVSALRAVWVCLAVATTVAEGGLRWVVGQPGQYPDAARAAKYFSVLTGH